MVTIILPIHFVQNSSPLRCEKPLRPLRLASLVDPQVEVPPVEPHLKLERSRDEVGAIVLIVLHRPPANSPGNAVAVRLYPLKQIHILHQII